MNPIKVIYVTHYSGFMGANRALFDLVCTLRDNGTVIPLVVIPSEGELSERLSNQGIEYIICQSYPNFFVAGESGSILPSLLKQTVKNYRNKVSARRLYRQLRNQGFQIVHSNSSATDIGSLIAKRLKVPHIWHFRENLKEHFNGRFVGGFNHRMKLYDKGADYIIGISRYICDYFSPFMSAGKVLLVYDGMPVKSLSGFKEPDRSEVSDVLRLCTVGLIHPSKQQLMIVESVKKCIDAGCDNIHLTIIGEVVPSNSYYQEIKQYIATYSLENYISFAGYVSNADEYIKSMDVGIIASKHEAFGRVTIEYMQSGLIPLAFKSGASPELITEGANGFIFDDGIGLQRILTHLSDLKKDNNYSELNRLKSNALSSANSYSLDDTVQNTIDVYTRVIAEHNLHITNNQ